jgi:hypothetical protein
METAADFTAAEPPLPPPEMDALAGNAPAGSRACECVVCCLAVLYREARTKNHTCPKSGHSASTALEAIAGAETSACLPACRPATPNLPPPAALTVTASHLVVPIAIKGRLDPDRAAVYEMLNIETSHLLWNEQVYTVLRPFLLDADRALRAGRCTLHGRLAIGTKRLPDYRPQVTDPRTLELLRIFGVTIVDVHLPDDGGVQTRLSVLASRVEAVRARLSGDEERSCQQQRPPPQQQQLPPPQDGQTAPTPWPATPATAPPQELQLQLSALPEDGSVLAVSATEWQALQPPPPAVPTSGGPTPTTPGGPTAPGGPATPGAGRSWRKKTLAAPVEAVTDQMATEVAVTTAHFMTYYVGAPSAPTQIAAQLFGLRFVRVADASGTVYWVADPCPLRTAAGDLVGPASGTLSGTLAELGLLADP